MKVEYKEKKRARFRISFVFLFIIASFSVCFTLYMKSDFDLNSEKMVNNDSEEAIQVINDITGTKRIVNPIIISEPEDISYLEKTLFIGNSELSGFSDYSFIPSKQVIAENGISITNINDFQVAHEGQGKNILSVINDVNPVGIYFLIGINETDLIKEKSFFNTYKDFIGSVSELNPEMNIYLISLLPVTADLETEDFTNSKIDAFNSSLLQFANDTGVCYLDINTELKGNDGKLPASMAEKNSAKLTRDTYSKLADYILTHLYRG